MNQYELRDFGVSFTRRMLETCENKNHDYAGAGTDAMANFTVVEKLGVCSAERGFLTRISDKYMRIVNFVNSGILRVADEKIEDTLLDLANYSLLLGAYLKDKRTKLVEEKKA